MYYCIAGIALLALIGAGVWYASKPGFWIAMATELGKRFVKYLLPDIRAYFAKRNSPEIEAEMHKCARMGGEWDNFNKKCRFK